MSSIKLYAALLIVVVSMSSISAQSISQANQTVRIGADGSARINMDIVFSSEDSISILKLPASFEDIDNPRGLLGDVPVEVSVHSELGLPFLQVEFADISGAHALHVEFEVESFMDWEKAGPEEFNTYNWAVTYINTQPLQIDAFELIVILPHGWNYHRISDSEPEFKTKEPKPPYQFEQLEDGASVSISRSPVGYMEKVSIDFAFKNEQKPSILIYVGILLSGLYLYYFRHLILRKDADGINDSDESKKEI